MHHVQPSASMFSQMTVLLILTGIVNSRVEDFTCERALDTDRTVGLGIGVTMQASCYPNGTVSYNWNSHPSVWYLRIDYQCYINGTTHEQTPNPVTKEQWSTVTNGDGTLNVHPWEEGTLCIFSGCYESRVRGFPIYVIPNTTCTRHTSMTAEVLSSPHLPMSATPLSSLQPIPSYPLLQQVSATPTVHPTPMLMTRPPPRMVTETSIVMTPNTTNPSVHSITVTVVLVLVTLMAVCPTSILVVTFIKRARPKARPTFVFDEKLIGDCPPISLSSYKPTQVSQETLLNVLEKPCPRNYFVSCENTSQVYVPSISEDASFSNELAELSNVQDNRSDITKPADGSDNVADSASVSTQTAKKEEEEEEEKVEEEKDEQKEEKVEEDEGEIEDGRRKEMHFELSEHVTCTEEKSVTDESLDCTKHLPEGEFSHCVDEPFTLDDNEPTAHSVSISELSCIDGDHLYSVPYVPSCSSESSGYVSQFTWNSGKQSC